MYATDYYETLILNMMRGQTAQAPTGLYLALYLNNPTDTGHAGTEVSYSGYARQPITFSAPAPMNSGIGIQNVNDITFPLTPVSLGSVSHVGVMDSLTGGNMLLYGEFTESLSVDANETPVVVDGEAQWWITGAMSTAYRTKVLNFMRGQALTGFIPCLALFNGQPESGGAELSGDNYERVAIAFGSPSEQAGGQMQITNSAQVNTNRSSTAWGSWSYTVVYDAQTAGQPVYFVSRTPKDITKGMMVVIEPGALNLSVN